ncbi:cortistatin [Lepus europaeus]|uniref:cortistatin n=1 Tax=Lepus europaeus TaxID=9983 RepID=UPI002B476B28|nr:cortistatin [Lepus europaeus]
MGSRRAGARCPPALGVLLLPGLPLLLLLLLLLSGAAATATLALEGGTGQDSGVSTAARSPARPPASAWLCMWGRGVAGHQTGLVFWAAPWYWDVPFRQLIDTRLTGDHHTRALTLTLIIATVSIPAQEGAAVEQSGLLTFLARWHAWTAQARGPSSRGDTGAMSRRQQGPPPPPAPPCRNFFWKTFSSCK